METGIRSGFFEKANSNSFGKENIANQSKDADRAMTSDSSNNELPEEIVLKADYSCYCKVCDCTLSRIKDAIQHAGGKRHKKAYKTLQETENKSTKRVATVDSDDNSKKIKTDEETKEEEEAREMLSKAFDETFHGGVVALRDNYYCKVCRCMIGNNRKNVNQHKEGKSHKMALDKFKKSLLSGTIGDEIPVEDPNQPFEGDGYIEKVKNAKRKTCYYCKICDFRTKERDAITEHMNGEQHQEKIRIAKEKEMMAEHGGYLEAQHINYENYQRFQQEDYQRTAITKGGMHQDEYYRELEMERFGPRNAYREDVYYDREELSPCYGRSFDADAHFNRQDPSFRGDYQNDINQDMWNHRHKNFMLSKNQENRPHFGAPVNSPLLDTSTKSDAILLPEVRTDQPAGPFFPQSHQGEMPFFPLPQQLPFMPQSQQTPVPFISQPQPTAVPFMPQSQLTPFPNNSQLQQTQIPSLPPSQQNILPESLVKKPMQKTEPDEQSQPNNSGDLSGFITNENDAEVIMDVINSLLQTYLKYRLQALPGSFMKLLRKSSKMEESVTRINKLATGKTTKQIFINVQNNKNKVQSASIPDEKKSPILYERRSDKDTENISSKTTPVNKSSYHEDAHSKTYSSFDSPDRANENNDSYDQRSYIEDQIKKALATRSMSGIQNEGSSLRKSKEIESSINDLFKQYGSSVNRDNKTEPPITDLFKQYRNSGRQDKTRPTELSVADFSKRYTSSSNSNISRRTRENENSISDMSMRYRNSNKEMVSGNDNNYQRIRQTESAVSDSFQQYRRSSKVEISSQSIRKNEHSNTDFSNRYRSTSIEDRSPMSVFPQQNRGFRNEESSSRNLQNKQSVFDLFKKYRSSNDYSHN